MSKIYGIVGLILNLVATIFLCLGSRHLPWDKQSIGGKTEEELKFFKEREKESRIGFALLFFGFLLQLVSIILP